MLALRSLPKILTSMLCNRYPSPAYIPAKTINAELQLIYQAASKPMKIDASNQAGQYPSTGSSYSKGDSAL
jgi:hypothetical protein